MYSRNEEYVANMMLIDQHLSYHHIWLKCIVLMVNMFTHSYIFCKKEMAMTSFFQSLVLHNIIKSFTQCNA